MDEEAAARFKIIAKTYNGPESGKPAVKTWQDARDIDPRITHRPVERGPKTASMGRKK